MIKSQKALTNQDTSFAFKRIDFTETELANGLKVILHKDSTIPSIAINLCYHVGSKDEDPDKRGYVHLLEHLMFEGSKNIPAGEYDNLALFRGCENNAYTTEDKTNYYLLLPSNELEFGLWLESDRMLGLVLTDESIETQKGVVIEEKKQIFDNRPYGSVSLEFPPRLFKNSGYKWDTIGDTGDIEKASLQTIKPFYDKFYHPGNAVLSISGDIDINLTIKLVEKYFGSIPGGKKPNKININELPLEQEVTADIMDNIQLPGIFIAYKVPAENEKGSFDLDILCDILSTGDSSRFYNGLVYKKQLVSEIGCWVDSKEFTGILYIYAILMPDISVSEVLNEIDNILNDVKSGKLTENELLKIKNRIETRKAYRLQTILAKADLLAHYKLFFNNPELINTNVENYMNVTLESIKDSAQNYLNTKNRVVLNYLPKN